MLATIAVIAAGFASTVPSRVKAQDVPTPFLPGFLESASVWSASAQSLASLLRITPLFPGVSTTQPIGTQSTQLNSFLGGLANLPSAAHSNGGLVGRDMARTFPGRINRMATVGTPHLGAPIGQVVRDRVPVAWATIVSLHLQIAFNESAALDPYFFQILDVFPFFGVHLRLADVANAANIIVGAIPTLLDNDFLPRVDRPVLDDELPGSPFLVSLNGSANLALEAQRFTPGGRASIATLSRPSGIVARMISPRPNVITTTVNIIQVAALVFADYYAVHPDLTARVILPGLWQQVFWDFNMLDAVWLDWIGARPFVIGGHLSASPSDGLIPGSHTVWGTSFQVPLPEVLHRNQTFDSRVRDQILVVFRDRFGLLLRSVPPPAPPPPPCEPIPPAIECG